MSCIIIITIKLDPPLITRGVAMGGGGGPGGHVPPPPPQKKKIMPIYFLICLYHACVNTSHLHKNHAYVFLKNAFNYA